MVIEHQRRKAGTPAPVPGETNAGRPLAFVVTERKGKVRFITAFQMPPEHQEICREEE